MGMSVIKTISLDENTAAIAKQVGNLSAFVRTALLIHAGGEDNFHTNDAEFRAKGGFKILIPGGQHMFTRPDGSMFTQPITLHTKRCVPYDKCPHCWPPMNGSMETQINEVKDELLKEWVLNWGNEQ